MRIEEKDGKIILHLKSTPTYFDDESTDIKNNIVMTPDQNHVWRYLRDFHDGDDINLWIQINEVFMDAARTPSGKNFLRKVKHVAYWNNLCIITWEPENKDDVEEII